MLASSPSHSRVALLLLGALLLPASAPSQDLAAAARKERERRAKVSKPAKVLTEDDGKEAGTKGTGSVTTLPGAGTTPSASSESPAAGAAVEESQRAAWKARADGARQAVVAAESKLSQMEREAAALRSDMAPIAAADAMDPMRLQKRDAMILKLNKDIEAQKVAIVDAKKALAAFEDEARRSGVPAGWLR